MWVFFCLKGCIKEMQTVLPEASGEEQGDKETVYGQKCSWSKFHSCQEDARDFLCISTELQLGYEMGKFTHIPLVKLKCYVVSHTNCITGKMSAWDWSRCCFLSGFPRHLQSFISEVMGRARCPSFGLCVFTSPILAIPRPFYCYCAYPLSRTLTLTERALWTLLAFEVDSAWVRSAPQVWGESQSVWVAEQCPYLQLSKLLESPDSNNKKMSMRMAPNPSIQARDF